MTLDGNHVRLPNALVFANPMVNYSRNPYRRFEFDLGVGTTDDLTVARQVCTTTLRAMSGVLRDPAPDALVMAIGDSTVTIRCLAWMDQRQTEYARVRGEAIRLVKTQLDAAGVSQPSPEYLVRLQREAPPIARESAHPRPALRPDRTMCRRTSQWTGKSSSNVDQATRTICWRRTHWHADPADRRGAPGRHAVCPSRLPISDDVMHAIGSSAAGSRSVWASRSSARST